MKIHLSRITGKDVRIVRGMACSRDPFRKGKLVALDEYLTIKKEDRCQKCDRIARKFTSYI
jgi:hypothetical protein